MKEWFITHYFDMEWISLCIGISGLVILTIIYCAEKIIKKIRKRKYMKYLRGNNANPKVNGEVLKNMDRIRIDQATGNLDIGAYKLGGDVDYIIPNKEEE